MISSTTSHPMDSRLRCSWVKILGGANPADVLTKYKTLPKFKQLLSLVGIEVVGKTPGR